ncbi:polysaccharide pyruvyl transferase family protein [Pseudomonas sp. NY15372]|uniref:polysaccharide pyruvyl transferase family protein n=1 Tax=Pseudomonas sp. NY15372 TaxID=3400356 RepID=UPI003A885216
MKIALITIHWANNYGAALQVYACAQSLSRFGQVSVIDYRCEYTSKGMQLFRFGWGIRDLLRLGKDLLRIFPRYRVIKKFSEFNAKNLSVTRIIRTDEDFKKLVSDFDVFVSGSDQIWNPKIVSDLGRLDGRFFLDFAQDKKRISYASSMGTYKYSPQEIKSVASYLNKYQFISVRESDTAVTLQEILGRSVEHVLDPTLLMNKSEWLSGCSKKTENRSGYILIYALKKDKLLKEVVEKTSSLLGLKVYSIDQDPVINYRCDRHMMDVGPDEFVELFSNASFVITNSFHGTAFSVNLNIPFIVTTPPTGINRINSLLKSVGLEDRIIGHYDEQALNRNIKDIDFSDSNKRLDDLRKKSFEFLEGALKDA